MSCETLSLCTLRMVIKPLFSIWTPETVLRKIKFYIEDLSMISKGLNKYKALKTYHYVISLEHLNKAKYAIDISSQSRELDSSSSYSCLRRFS
jgi:hypothetical protein